MVHNPTIVAEKTTKEDPFTGLVGEFGRWQFLVFGTLSVIKLSSAWVQMAVLFLTPNLTFWCNNFGNESRIAENNTCYEDCLEYKYDTSPFDNTIISEWDLVCQRRWLASFTQTVLQFGILVGSIPFGFLSDRYGRKRTFLASIIALIVFGFGIPFSPNYVVFTTLRFFLGMATAGNMMISFIMVMESIGSKYRGVVGCLFQIPFVMGHITVLLFAYYFRSWNAYTLAMAVLCLMYLNYFFLLNESPRWLVSVGRVDEATKIVEKAALINNLPTTKVEETLKKLSEVLSSKKSPKANYFDLLRSSLRVKTACCCIMWLVSGFTYFGLNQYISQTSPDPFVSVAAAGAIQIPANFISIWLICNVGRKTTTMAFFVLGGMCIIVLAFVPNLFWLKLTLGSLGVSCTGIVTNAIYIYTSELYPTVVRNMGMGASSTSMRIGSMIAPFISNMSLNMPWLPNIIFGTASICAGVVCLWLPETKGNTLMDKIDEAESSL